MGSNNIIIREYLESLKEDNELDYLFPLLLNAMKFRVVATAKESKGQSQYGKDIIAIGRAKDGKEYRYYFELKGHKDKDITNANYYVNDGVRESILEAKDTVFNDSSIPKFNYLPIKIIFVHNGTIKMNIRPTFEGLISKEFNEGEFERWDIYYLTDLFSEYFFNEYLLTDEVSLRLFKRTLVLLDAPSYDYQDFKTLVNIQIKRVGNRTKGRSFKKFFATQNLLATIILHYSRENNNLEAAKNCLTYLLLKTWGWILVSKIEERQLVKQEFTKLIKIHYSMLDLYFNKTLPFTIQENGLFAENGNVFEEVGYPLRSFEYLNYLIYYSRVKEYLPTFKKKKLEEERKVLRRVQKDLIQELIENNKGCTKPLMDNHSIAIVNVFLFFLDKEDLEDKDLRFVGEFLYRTMETLIIIKQTRNRFPILNNDKVALTKTVARNEKVNYEDRSSLLITTLFELAAIINFKEFHRKFKTFFDGKVNLQVISPNFEEYDIEQLIFEKQLNQELKVITSIDLKSNLEEFKNWIKNSKISEIHYRTDKAGFPYLRNLAHIYYKNDFFVEKWRNYLQ